MKIILVGGFSEMFELCEELGYEILGYIDKTPLDNLLKDYNYPYLGNDKEFNYNRFKELAEFVVTPDDPNIRERIYHSQKNLGLNYSRLISSHSMISRTAYIGKGTVVQFGSHVSAHSWIGSFVKINVYANVMHESKIGDFSTIAPNAAIMGRVTIGKKCYIGANATVLPSVTICDNVIVGAGAVVTKDILAAGTYVGVPSRKLW